MDELEKCERCGEDFEHRELNDVGLCRRCEEDEARDDRAERLDAMSNSQIED
jgi:hypothetical protein